MAKRSLPPTSKNASRLSKRAKVTNLKGFFSVKSAQKPDQATKSVSPSSKNTSVVHVPESSTISTHLPELVEFVPCNDEPIEVSDVEVVSIDTPLNRESTDGDSDIFPLSPVSTDSSSVDSSSYDTETLNTLISTEPHQPDVSIIPPKKTKSQNIYFQQKWFREYSWLTYDTTIQRVLCHTCASAAAMKMMNLATKSDPTFQTVGFCNWKKAKERFQSHSISDSHRHAAFVLASQKQKSIRVHICHEEEQKQRERRHCLKKILRRIRFLLRQGLAFRGHLESEGNLYQILQDDAEDDPLLATYLQQDTSFISWASQKEFARDLSHMILRSIAKVIKNCQTHLITWHNQY